MCVADTAYQEMMLEDPEFDRKESFFNTSSDYQFSSTQFRFSLPGLHLTDDYRRHIRGYFQNEPCMYNHVVFGYAASFFEIMKHTSESMQPPAAKARGMAVKKTQGATTPARPKTFQQRPASRKTSLVPDRLPSIGAVRRKGSTSPGSTSRPGSQRHKHSDALDSLQIEFVSQNEKRLTYQLVFQTLKCMALYFVKREFGLFREKCINLLLTQAQKN